ncbi:hypothetical protein [Pseudonocardia sp.]|jgi:hypothetical protein|uniref:hypothetical protein n=1 Tax=Pseudonocardia sp. TaxID=60912 RepID=UPI003D0B07B3
MRPAFTAQERAAVRRRFDQDQADAEYVEYTEAMERLSTPRRWKRARAKFLRSRGYRSR